MEEKYLYCELIGRNKTFSSKINIIVDYGEQKPLFSDLRLKDENGKVQTFNSLVDALNYMGNLGWEFVQAYIVTFGTDKHVYHWLLKKKV